MTTSVRARHGFKIYPVEATCTELLYLCPWKQPPTHTGMHPYALQLSNPLPQGAWRCSKGFQLYFYNGKRGLSLLYSFQHYLQKQPIRFGSTFWGEKILRRQRPNLEHVSGAVQRVTATSNCKNLFRVETLKQPQRPCSPAGKSLL